MIKNLLFKYQEKRQLVIALIGALLGITFLISSVHYLHKINEYGEDSEILGKNTLILQKKVTSASTMGLTKTDFSEKEISKMKLEPFVEDVKPVISNNFRVWFETNDPYVPTFKSDVFIQAVSKEFLDVKSEKWHWKEGEKFVPMIMPRDFLVMLNTFMNASGIPQVSDDLAMKLKFRLRISDGQKEEWVDTKIIGFTNEIASILVPENFMEYATKKFAQGDPGKITQIMVAGKEGEFGKLETFMNDRGLESKNSQVVVSRLKSIVGTLFAVILVISIVAVFASGLVLIQYMQLVLSHNKYEVRTLLRLGIHPTLISKTFFRYFLFVFILVLISGFGFFALLKYFVDEIFQTGGIYMNENISLLALTSIFLTFIIFAFASYRTARNEVFTLFNK
ncbi:MAG: FtsX-like permease family protein [Bacteroidota bacterium]